MPFDMDFTGVEINKFSPKAVPAGTYNMSIVKATEKLTKKGDPMVVVDYEIVDGDYIGKIIKNHCVVFFKDKESPGAGMAKAFLKTIGLANDGAVQVDPTKWIGRRVVGKVINEDVTMEDKETGKPVKRTFAKVKYVNEYVIDYTIQQAPPVSSANEDIPF